MKTEKNTKKPSSKKSKLSTAGFILGIVAIATFWIFGLGGIVAIPGIILSAIGLAHNNEPKSKKKALIGLILSCVAIILAVILMVVGSVLILKLIYEFGGHPFGA